MFRQSRSKTMDCLARLSSLSKTCSTGGDDTAARLQAFNKAEYPGSVAAKGAMLLRLKLMKEKEFAQYTTRLYEIFVLITENANPDDFSANGFVHAILLQILRFDNPSKLVGLLLSYAHNDYRKNHDGYLLLSILQCLRVNHKVRPGGRDASLSYLEFSGNFLSSFAANLKAELDASASDNSTPSGSRNGSMRIYHASPGSVASPRGITSVSQSSWHRVKFACEALQLVQYLLSMDFTDNSGSGSSSTMKKFKSIVANISTACRKCVDICSVEKSAALAPGLARECEDKSAMLLSDWLLHLWEHALLAWTKLEHTLCQCQWTSSLSVIPASKLLVEYLYHAERHVKEMLEEEHDSNASASNPGSPISVSTAHKHHTDVMAINPRQRLYCQLLSKILSSIASISEATIQYCEVLTTKAEADRQRSGNDDGIAKKCQDWLNELANVISSGVVGAYLHTHMEEIGSFALPCSDAPSQPTFHGFSLRSPKVTIVLSSFTLEDLEYPSVSASIESTHTAAIHKLLSITFNLLSSLEQTDWPCGKAGPLRSFVETVIRFCYPIPLHCISPQSFCSDVDFVGKYLNSAVTPKQRSRVMLRLLGHLAVGCPVEARPEMETTQQIIYEGLLNIITISLDSGAPDDASMPITQQSSSSNWITYNSAIHQLVRLAAVHVQFLERTIDILCQGFGYFVAQLCQCVVHANNQQGFSSVDTKHQVRRCKECLVGIANALEYIILRGTASAGTEEEGISVRRILKPMLSTFVTQISLFNSEHSFHSSFDVLAEGGLMFLLPPIGVAFQKLQHHDRISDDLSLQCKIFWYHMCFARQCLQSDVSMVTLAGALDPSSMLHRATAEFPLLYSSLSLTSMIHRLSCVSPTSFCASLCHNPCDTYQRSDALGTSLHPTMIRNNEALPAASSISDNDISTLDFIVVSASLSNNGKSQMQKQFYAKLKKDLIKLCVPAPAAVLFPSMSFKSIIKSSGIGHNIIQIVHQMTPLQVLHSMTVYQFAVNRACQTLDLCVFYDLFLIPLDVKLSLVLSSQASNLYTNWFNAVNTFEVANKGSAPVLDVPYDYHVCGTCSSTYVLQVIKTVLTRCTDKNELVRNMSYLWLSNLLKDFPLLWTHQSVVFLMLDLTNQRKPSPTSREVLDGNFLPLFEGEMAHECSDAAGVQFFQLCYEWLLQLKIYSPHLADSMLVEYCLSRMGHYSMGDKSTLTVGTAVQFIEMSVGLDIAKEMSRSHVPLYHTSDGPDDRPHGWLPVPHADTGESFGLKQGHCDRVVASQLVAASIHAQHTHRNPSLLSLFATPMAADILLFKSRLLSTLVGQMMGDGVNTEGNSSGSGSSALSHFLRESLNNLEDLVCCPRESQNHHSRESELIQQIWQCTAMLGLLMHAQGFSRDPTHRLLALLSLICSRDCLHCSANLISCLISCWKWILCNGSQGSDIGTYVLSSVVEALQLTCHFKLGMFYTGADQMMSEKSASIVVPPYSAIVKNVSLTAEEPKEPSMQQHSSMLHAQANLIHFLKEFCLPVGGSMRQDSSLVSNMVIFMTDIFRSWNAHPLLSHSKLLPGVFGVRTELCNLSLNVLQLSITSASAMSPIQSIKITSEMRRVCREYMLLNVFKWFDSCPDNDGHICRCVSPTVSRNDIASFMMSQAGYCAAIVTFMRLLKTDLNYWNIDYITIPAADSRVPGSYRLHHTPSYVLKRLQGIPTVKMEMKENGQGLFSKTSDTSAVDNKENINNIALQFQTVFGFNLSFCPSTEKVSAQYPQHFAKWGKRRGGGVYLLLRMLLLDELNRVEGWMTAKEHEELNSACSHVELVEHRKMHRQLSGDVQSYKVAIRAAWLVEPSLAYSVLKRFPVSAQADGVRKGISTFQQLLRINPTALRHCSFVCSHLLHLSTLPHMTAKTENACASSLPSLLGTWAPASAPVAIDILNRHHTALRGSSTLPSLCFLPSAVRYAVRSISLLPQHTILFYLPQLIQLMRRDVYGILASKLLEPIAHRSATVCHQIMWLLQAESGAGEVSVSVASSSEKGSKDEHKYGRCKELSGIDPLPNICRNLIAQIREGLSPEALHYMDSECEYMNSITNISALLKVIKNKELHNSAIEEALKALGPVPGGLYLPTDPCQRVVSIDLESGTPMQSAAKCPYLLVFKTVPWAGPDSFKPLIPPPVEILARNSPGNGGLKSSQLPPANGIVRQKSKVVGIGSMNSLAFNSPRRSLTSAALESGSSSTGNVPQPPAPTTFPSLKNAVASAVAVEGQVLPADGMEDSNDKEESHACIFKVFDDCRQDALTIQVMVVLQGMYLTLGLPLYLMPYAVIPTATGKPAECGGILEVIKKVHSRDGLGKNGVKTLKHLFLSRYGPENGSAYKEALIRFASSVAASGVVCYLLSIKDRHNGNLLIDNLGHLVHIDFGFLLGISPGGNLGFETAAFKLSPEIVELLGGTRSHFFRHVFIDTMCVRSFLAARQLMTPIITLVEAFADSGLPCFMHKSNNIAVFKERFMPELTETAAATVYSNLIFDAACKSTTIIYDGIQKLQNNIYSDTWK